MRVPLIGGVLHTDQALRALALAFGAAWPSARVRLLALEWQYRGVYGEYQGTLTSLGALFPGLQGQGQHFIEVKLTEQEYGGCLLFQEARCDGQNPLRGQANCDLSHMGCTS